jgi:hypothetical protein
MEILRGSKKISIGVEKLKFLEKILRAVKVSKKECLVRKKLFLKKSLRMGKNS